MYAYDVNGDGLQNGGDGAFPDDPGKTFELLDKHTDDPVLETIRRAGPQRLLRELEEAGVTREIGIRSAHAGMCDLCLDINSNPAAVAILRERLSGSKGQAELTARRLVLKRGSSEGAIGLQYANGPGAAKLWLDGASGRIEQFAPRYDLRVATDAAFSASGLTPTIAVEGAHASVIGGAEIFALFLPLADRIELTEVLADIDGDTAMDDPRGPGWREVIGDEHPAQDGRPPFRFVTLERG